MRVLLTGGAGYIGSHTAVALLNAGHEVIIVDNYVNSSPIVTDRIKNITDRELVSYEADVTDSGKMTEILSKEKPHCVIHFAGLKAVAESIEKPIEYYRNNINCTLSLLEAMKEANVKLLVFSSSATVYGEDNNPPFKEDMPKGNCSNPYGWTKWMQEQIIIDAAKQQDLGIVILRYFNPVGAHSTGFIGEDPRGIPNNLMPYISQVAVGTREKLTVFGNDYDTPDGTCLRDYIHVMDLATGHVKAVEYIEKNGGVEIFNLGTGQPYSVLEVVKAFELASGKEISCEIGARRPGDVPGSWADVSKAASHLGWKAERDIIEMCRDAWTWQSNNPNGYEKSGL